MQHSLFFEFAMSQGPCFLVPCITVIMFFLNIFEEGAGNVFPLACRHASCLRDVFIVNQNSPCETENTTS